MLGTRKLDIVPECTVVGICSETQKLTQRKARSGAVNCTLPRKEKRNDNLNTGKGETFMRIGDTPPRTVDEMLSAYDLAKRHVIDFTKKHFLFWPISILLICIDSVVSIQFIHIVALIMLFVILVRSIQLNAFIVSNYRYVIVSIRPFAGMFVFINSGVIGLATLLAIQGSSNWYVIPLIVLSFFLFCVLGGVLSEKRTSQ